MKLAEVVAFAVAVAAVATGCSDRERELRAREERQRQRRLEETEREEARKRAEAAATSTATSEPSGVTTDGHRLPAEVIPEAFAHPDYPTVSRSGTGDIFYLEEPDRGPHVTEVAIPGPAGLRFSEHRHCELDHATLVCSGATGG